MSTPLQQALEDYLTIRRQLGYQLHGSGRLLAGFVRFVEQAGARTITVDAGRNLAVLVEAAVRNRIRGTRNP